MSGILGAEGGRLSDFIGNKILMTIGDGSSYEGHRRNDPQKTESFLGKIISIDEDTKEYELLSMGHRHPQGLFYDKESNIIFSTEHGPKAAMRSMLIFLQMTEKLKTTDGRFHLMGNIMGFPDLEYL